MLYFRSGRDTHSSSLLVSKDKLRHFVSGEESSWIVRASLFISKRFMWLLQAPPEFPIFSSQIILLKVATVTFSTFTAVNEPC